MSTRVRRPLEQNPIPHIGRDVHERLLEQQRKESSLRSFMLGSIEGTELRAIRNLACELFGEDRGQVGAACIQITEDKPGLVQVGRFLDPRQLVDGAMRRRVIFFIGATHREICDQVRIWKAAQA